MIDPSGLQKLLTWLSPAFPVGSFAWSGGLETAIASRQVASPEATRRWIEGSLNAGAIRTDAIILSEAYRSAEQPELLAELADFALALTSSVERQAETIAMGRAFLLAAEAWPSSLYRALPQRCPYPVAVGVAAAAHRVPLRATLIAFLAAAVHTQVSVAVRLVPIGQTAGLAIIAAIEPLITVTAALAETASVEDVGTIAYAADIAQMRHEALEPRIFRS